MPPHIAARVGGEPGRCIGRHRSGRMQRRKHAGQTLLSEGEI